MALSETLPTSGVMMKVHPENGLKEVDCSDETCVRQESFMKRDPFER